MKRIFTAALLLSLTIVLSHCGSDDGDGGSTPENDIDADALALVTGQWSADFATASNCDDSNDNGIKDCGELLTCLAIKIEEVNGSQYILVSDNTGEVGFLDTYAIKSLSSSKIVYCDQFDETICYTVNYSVSGSSLTATYTNDDYPGCTLQATFTKDDV